MHSQCMGRNPGLNNGPQTADIVIIFHFRAYFKNRVN